MMCILVEKFGYYISLKYNEEERGNHIIVSSGADLVAGPGGPWPPPNGKSSRKNCCRL